MAEVMDSVAAGQTAQAKVLAVLMPSDSAAEGGEEGGNGAWERAAAVRAAMAAKAREAAKMRETLMLAEVMIVPKRVPRALLLLVESSPHPS